MNQKKTEGKLLTIPYIVVMLSYLVQNLGYAMVSTNMAPYAQTIGVAGTLLGLFSGLMSIAALVSRPVSGWISDNLNRKTANAVSLLAFALVFAGYAFCKSPVLLLVFRVLHGIVFGIFTTVNMSMIADSVSEDRLVQATTYYGLMSTIGNAVAPAIGVWIQEKFGYEAMFLSGGALFLLSYIIVLLMQGRQEKKKPEPFRLSLDSMIHLPSVPLAVIALLNGMAAGAVIGLLLVFAEERSIQNASIFFTISAVSSVITRPVFAALSKKITANHLVQPCILASVLTLIILAFSYSSAAVIIAGCFYGLGYGAAIGFIQGMILLDVSEKERGIASSTMYIGLDLGNFIGPTLMSLVVSACGNSYTAGFLAIACMPAISFVMMFAVNLRIKKKA